MKTRNVLPSILCIQICFIAANGQQTQYDKGTPPQLAAGVSSVGSYMSTELGTVNLTNGGLNLNIPLGTVGGRGNVAIPLTLSYSSKVWSASTDVDLRKPVGLSNRWLMRTMTIRVRLQALRRPAGHCAPACISQRTSCELKRS